MTRAVIFRHRPVSGDPLYLSAISIATLDYVSKQYQLMVEDTGSDGKRMFFDDGCNIEDIKHLQSSGWKSTGIKNCSRD